MGMSNAYKMLNRKLEGHRPPGRFSTDVRIKLKWILKK
jgi:hypothetical protein